MLWIHAGGFTGGDATTLTDPEFLLDEDVVFVAIQYWLGVLGFLAEENSANLLGNLGLRDQQEAMRWVKRNIASFGGDPAKVTATTIATINFIIIIISIKGDNLW